MRRNVERFTALRIAIAGARSANGRKRAHGLRSKNKMKWNAVK